MHVGKEAGSQHFGFTRTTDTQSWKGPYSTACPVTPHPTPDGVPTAGWLAHAGTVHFSLVFLTFGFSYCYHPVLCKLLKEKKKSKKSGLVYCPGSLEISSEESLEDEFYFK